MVRFFLPFLMLLISTLSGCDSNSGNLNARVQTVGQLANDKRLEADEANKQAAQKNLYFGDLHVHTSVSMDAILWGNRLGMEEAYRFAKGEALTLPGGATTRLSTPLDFVAITDHASSFETDEFCFSGNAHAKSDELCEKFKKPSNEYFELAMKRLRQRPVTRFSGFCQDDEDVCLAANAKTWGRVQTAANKANEPGKFTSFIAYEYSPAMPKQGKIHRNIIFRNATVPENAISIYDAASEIDLWKALNRTCLDDCDFLTIPHNMNLTWGYAFAMQTIDGNLYSDEDLRLRAASEPIAEIFQSKGASECALGVGATDEECGFEQLLQPCIDGETEACAMPGSFVRNGLEQGLELQVQKGFNPFKIGFIGSTDSHNSNPGDTEEADYVGAMGMMDNTSEKRLNRDKKRHPRSNRNVLYYNPGGLAAVWAEENTRESLFDAMMRREVYATSGSRISLKVYAGWDDAMTIDSVEAVPMGSSLSPAQKGTSPHFAVWAGKDVNSANLQRIQMIKGWMEGNVSRHSVRDIACSDSAKPDPITMRCPDNGATVDLDTCHPDDSKGAAQLHTVWTDTEFDSTQASFYYVRVIENPICRWSTHDALRLARELKPQVSGEIQERAWSSPIWYTPEEQE